MTRRMCHLAAVAVGLVLAPALSQRAAAQPEAEASMDVRVGDRPSWSLRLSAEAGAGGRDVDLPMDGVVYRIRPGLFPVGGLGFELDHAASEAVTLGLLFRYQSSLAHGIDERHTDGSVHPLDVRSQRLELAVAPRFRLDSAGVFTLRTAAGYGFHDFRPEVHRLLTPAYSLVGPQLRIGFELAPFGDVITLILAPEGQWIAHVSHDLVDRGLQSQGLGAGGEAGLELKLGRRWAVRAAYREMRMWLDSAQAQRFEDAARFITARVTGTL